MSWGLYQLFHGVNSSYAVPGVTQAGETKPHLYTGACTKVAMRSPKPLVVGSIPFRPCQAREKKLMIAADLFANRFGVSWSEVSLVLYGPLARRSSGWLITGWPRLDSWMVHQSSTRPWAYHPTKSVTAGRIRACATDGGDDDNFHRPIYTTP